MDVGEESGDKFASINLPIAGATHEKDLPVGRHPLQIYSMDTPNGVKVTIMLEELLAFGYRGAEYDAWLIRFIANNQFRSGVCPTESQFEDSNPHEPHRRNTCTDIRIRCHPAKSFWYPFNAQSAGVSSVFARNQRFSNNTFNTLVP